MKKNTTVFCTNCGKQGHIMKQCQEPITSYGILLFRYISPIREQASRLSSVQDTSGLEVLLIRRRDTLGFIELMRGKYGVQDIEYIKKHISVMTTNEQQKLLTQSFQELWEGLWGKPVEGTNAYRHEREVSHEKLEFLQKNGILAQLIAEVNSSYTEPEWGFPKGRRELFESDYACAIREVYEETGIDESDICILKNVEPLTEAFTGSNGISYRHKYFIGVLPDKKALTDPATVESMRREVSHLEWMSVDTALAKIRPYNQEKRDVLMRAQNFLRNYCPLFIPPEIDDRRGRRELHDRRTSRGMGYRKRY
jgi:8-oxo-dGTP pyrophosphatase MutT (NUDIX family)